MLVAWRMRDCRQRPSWLCLFSFAGMLCVLRADVVVKGRVILELKVADRITKQHEAQLVHHLRSSEMEIGLVLNFGEPPAVRRVAFANDPRQAFAEGPKVSGLTPQAFAGVGKTSWWGLGSLEGGCIFGR